MKEHKIYFVHILEAITKIDKYTKHVSFEKFIKNDEKKDAVVRNLEIIGEAAAKIPHRIRKKYPKTAWRDIIDMRNRLIHEYFGVDFGIVWDVINNELPLLKKQFDKYLGR